MKEAFSLNSQGRRNVERKKFEREYKRETASRFRSDDRLNLLSAIREGRFFDFFDNLQFKKSRIQQYRETINDAVFIRYKLEVRNIHVFVSATDTKF